MPRSAPNGRDYDGMYGAGMDARRKQGGGKVMRIVAREKDQFRIACDHGHDFKAPRYSISVEALVGFRGDEKSSGW